MQKRGQVTLFLIIGIVLILAFGLVYYFSNYKTTKTAKTQTQVAGNSDVKDIVKSYAENCLKKVTEEALFNKIGVQGGYINFAQEGNPTTTFFDGYNVPVYLEVNCNRYCFRMDCTPPPPECEGNCCHTCTCGEYRCSWTSRINPSLIQAAQNERQYCNRGNCDCSGYCPCTDGTSYTYTLNIPVTIEQLAQIRQRLTNYIMGEFNNCFDTNIFKRVGIEVTKPVASNPNVEVNLNEEDVSVKLNYPLTVKRGETEAKLESFIVIIPIRIKKLYEGALAFINNIESRTNIDTPVQPLVYDITDNSRNDCNTYNKNRLTNVYAKNGETNTKVIQFVDFSTYLQKYFKSFVFQFAVKGVEISGACAG